MKNLLIVFVWAISLFCSCKKSDQVETPSTPNTSKDTVSDIDGNIYRTVKIGNQVWMAENLRVTRYNNGDSITNPLDDVSWKFAGVGAWCNYGNAPFLDTVYGKLYNWYAISDPRGIAPKGWRIPSAADWQLLVDSLGGKDSAGASIKEVSLLWQQDNPANNKSKFSARPGGYRDGYYGYFADINRLCYFWSSLPSNESFSLCVQLFHYNKVVSIFGTRIASGMSIRCIKN